jgi:NAD(P)H-dependent FMN reductase
MDEKGVRIVVINGSVRPGNYTAMASALVVDELKKHTHPNVQVDVVKPAEWQLPFPGTSSNSPATSALQKLVRNATGVVLVTPEYHGGFSSVMKLVIENLGFPSVLSTKPVALLGVAAGTIGAIKSLEQLRSVCAHIGAIVLPLPISIPNVQRVFDKDGRCLDPNVEKVIRSVATNLMNYIHNAICPSVTLERLSRSGVGITA